MADLLGQRAASLDAASFVGRAAELTRLRALLEDAGAGPVVAYVHGPGGVGKSALLRALGRAAEAQGWAVRRVDGREIGPSAEALDEAIGEVDATPATLLLLDGFESMGALAGHLRDQLLGALPPTARVAIASRHAPDPAWRSSLWGAAMAVIALEPLGAETADELLVRRGVADVDRRRWIARWAAGLPLALTVGAEAVGHGDTPVPRDLDAALASVLLGELLADEVGEGDRDVLAVAALAPRTDARLLAAVLPGVDADAAFAWLGERSFAERAGSHLVLHDRLAAALAAELRARHPDHERELRRRVLEHLYQRILLGEPWLTTDLPMLSTDPAIRYGSGARGSLRSDRVRPGDLEALRAAVLARGQRWSPSAERWFEEAPEHVVVLRSDDQIAGAGISVAPTWLPAWAPEDPLVGRWLEHMATGALPSEDVLCLRDGYDVLTPPDAPVSEVVALGNTALMRRAGFPNPRHFIVVVEPGDPRMDAFVGAFGYEPVLSLDHEEAGHLLRTFTVDHGPGGVAHMLRASVLAELGVALVEPGPPRVAAVDAVRDALRSFHDPLELSASALARGGTVTERAESVRRLLRQAVETAFGPSEDEQLTRAVIERGYLDPDGGHARAARALHLSRTTYFRRLATAAERVTQAVVDLRAGGTPR